MRSSSPGSAPDSTASVITSMSFPLRPGPPTSSEEHHSKLPRHSLTRLSPPGTSTELTRHCSTVPLRQLNGTEPFVYHARGGIGMIRHDREMIPRHVNNGNVT